MQLSHCYSTNLITAISIAVTLGCSGKVAYDTATVSSNTGGSSSDISNQSSSGGSVSTGGSVSFTEYCNGLYQGLACGSTSVQADVNAVNMLLVIDGSGSMNDHASSATGESKWVELIHAIEASLVGAAEGINFGLELFPYDPAGISPGAYDPAVLCNVPNGQGAIAVDIAPGQGNVAHITDILSGQYPAGATPTANALQQAYNYYTQGDGKNLNGSKWVLLVTDGARC